MGGHCCCSPLCRLEASGKYIYIYICTLYIDVCTTSCGI
jgi:hypothetical protein